MKYITSEGYKLLAEGSRVSIDKVMFGNSGVTSGSTLQGKKLYECAPHRVGTTGNGFTVEAVIGKDSGIADHEVIREIVLYSGATPFVRVVVPSSEYIASETSLSFTVVIELAQASSVILEVTNSSQSALQSHVEEAEKKVVDIINEFKSEFAKNFETLLDELEKQNEEQEKIIVALENKIDEYVVKQAGMNAKNESFMQRVNAKFKAEADAARKKAEEDARKKADLEARRRANAKKHERAYFRAMQRRMRKGNPR